DAQHQDAVATGSANVQLDAGPTITPATPDVVEINQMTVVGTVTPGLPGDALNLVSQTETAGGTLSLQLVGGVEEIVYTAASAIPSRVVDNVSYSIDDQHHDAVATGSANVQLDAGPTITPATPDVVEINQVNRVDLGA